MCALIIFSLIIIIEATSKALKNFVEVASGGDGDYNTDRLINLETVGSGFGPLIYQLPQTAGYDSWHQRCEEVWSNLKQNIDLPKILVCFIRGTVKPVYI